MIKNLRHSDNVIQIPQNDIIPGDKVWNCGELFEATEVSGYKDAFGIVIIRYTGIAVAGYNNYQNDSRFDGGTYGARADVTATIVKRNL